MRLLWTSLVALVVIASTSCRVRTTCLASADSVAARGWEHYRADSIPTAAETFNTALSLCPRHNSATVGLGYVALREGRLDDAERRFNAAVARDSAQVDAHVGLGIAAWRQGELEAVHEQFTRVQALDPTRPEAHDYLARLPGGIGAPPERPPLVLADSLLVPARTNGDRFEIATRDGWKPFYIKGVNLGAALPGRHPSQFPDSTVYAEWVAEMVAMGTNAVRVYTIHPPHFYQALSDFNQAHPDTPLWLIHGVWAELPPGHNFDDATWRAEFVAEEKRVVDLIHGRADIRPRTGHASGFYTADVSRWTLAYIIGREWEPAAVEQYDTTHTGGDWQGRYLSVRGGTAMDGWLAGACEHMIAYETERYRTQRPIAYTSWPTLDPLVHPTETSVREELAIREALGDSIDVVPKEYDNDVVAIHPNRIRPTAEFTAGFFASYHAYPYYPDIMLFGSDYGEYLRRLKQHHRDMPVVIAEYGVPASIGVAHLAREGWHHGGHTEAGMATVDSALTVLIAECGMAGGILFAWIDEWFKKTWVVIDLEIPLERNRMWYSRMNAEQHYGVFALEPTPRLHGTTLAERLADWRRIPDLYAGRLRAQADEAYLWLLLEPNGSDRAEVAYVGLDVVNPDGGGFRWPGGGPRLPIGIEFALVQSAAGVRLVAEHSANPFRIKLHKPLGRPVHTLTVDAAPASILSGQFSQRYNRWLRPAPSPQAYFEPLWAITNRRRFGRDTTVYAAIGYDRGVLPEGPPPDGLWELDPSSGTLEVRIPWTLINVADPSSRQVLSTPEGRDSTLLLEPPFETVTVGGVRILVGSRAASGAWRLWPQSGAARDVALFSWSTWDEPQWRARRRPVFSAVRSAFDVIDQREPNE